MKMKKSITLKTADKAPRIMTEEEKLADGYPPDPCYNRKERPHRKKKATAGPRSPRTPKTRDPNKKRVAPARQRRPRPWEPGGAELWKTSLQSEEFISRCCMLWSHGVSDKGISYSLGVNFRDFSHWTTELQRPFLFTVTLWGETQQVKCTFGELRARMKETFEPVYLTKLKQIIQDAEIQGDLKTASANVKWLMEKVMPRKYGKHETLNINNIPIAIKTAGDDGDTEGELSIADI